MTKDGVNSPRLPDWLTMPAAEPDCDRCAELVEQHDQAVRAGGYVQTLNARFLMRAHLEAQHDT